MVECACVGSRLRISCKRLCPTLCPMSRLLSAMSPRHRMPDLLHGVPFYLISQISSISGFNGFRDSARRETRCARWPTGCARLTVHCPTPNAESAHSLNLILHTYACRLAYLYATLLSCEWFRFVCLGFGNLRTVTEFTWAARSSVVPSHTETIIIYY